MVLQASSGFGWLLSVLNLPSVAWQVVEITICINAFGGLRLWLSAGLFKVQMPQSRESIAASSNCAAISNRRMGHATEEDAEKSKNATQILASG